MTPKPYSKYSGPYIKPRRFLLTSFCLLPYPSPYPYPPFADTGKCILLCFFGGGPFKGGIRRGDPQFSPVLLKAHQGSGRIPSSLSP